MKAEKFRELSGPELEAQLRDNEARIWRIRFQGATGQTEGLMKLRSLRKDVARIRTVQREKQLEKK